MTVVSIHQPAYLPWLGYFHRIAASDVHVVLDHVQFEKDSFVNRNRVRTAQGPRWLTVPVRTRGRFGDLAIRGLQVDAGSRWRRQHWETLRQSYARAPFFAEHAPFFEAIYAREWTHLLPLCTEINDYLLRAFAIATPRRLSSEMDPRGVKADLVLELVQKAGGKVYFSGALGRDYLRPEAFEAAGVRLVYQDYVHPTYPQVHGGFEPYLSAVDLLFNCGPRSGEVITAGQPRS